jgi:hypothetical protein
MRTLRTYQHMAQREHYCDRCRHPIFPGNFYRGEVHATGTGLWVEKRHLDPECPKDHWEEYEETSSPSEGFERRRSRELELEVAA